MTTVAGIRPAVSRILPHFNGRYMGLNFSQSSLSSTSTRSTDRSVAHNFTHTSLGFLGWHIIRPYSTTSLNSHHCPDRLCLSPPWQEPSQQAASQPTLEPWPAGPSAPRVSQIPQVRLLPRQPDPEHPPPVPALAPTPILRQPPKRDMIACYPLQTLDTNLSPVKY